MSNLLIIIVQCFLACQVLFGKCRVGIYFAGPFSCSKVSAFCLCYLACDPLRYDCSINVLSSMRILLVRFRGFSRWPFSAMEPWRWNRFRNGKLNNVLWYVGDTLPGNFTIYLGEANKAQYIVSFRFKHTSLHLYEGRVRYDRTPEAAK
jgi:hypothetical protein